MCAKATRSSAPIILTFAIAVSRRDYNHTAEIVGTFTSAAPANALGIWTREWGSTFFAGAGALSFGHANEQQHAGNLGLSRHEGDVGHTVEREYRVRTQVARGAAGSAEVRCYGLVALHWRPCSMNEFAYRLT